MKIWKMAFAALILLPLSFTAKAETVTTVMQPPPAGGYFYPPPYGYAAPAASAAGQQVQQQIGTLVQPQSGNNQQSGQQATPVQYIYRGRELGGAISKAELPQRIFKNIPMHVYGSGNCIIICGGR